MFTLGSRPLPYTAIHFKKSSPPSNWKKGTISRSLLMLHTCSSPPQPHSLEKLLCLPPRQSYTTREKSLAKGSHPPLPDNCWAPFPEWGQEIWHHMRYDMSGYVYKGISAFFKKIPRSCLQRHLALSQARPFRDSSQYSTCSEGSSLSLLIHLSCLQMPQSCE